MTTWRSRIVETGTADPRSLIANPKNWRKHPKAQADALSGVLGEVGWVQDVIVNRTTGHLVDGHLRVEIAARDNQPTIPVTYVELTEAEEALILATFDPISAMATADAELLRELLDGVSTGEAAVQQMIADLAEREGVLEIARNDGLTDPDEVPEPPVVPVTQPGDLWILGRHRLLCGDSTNSEDVAAVIKDDPVGAILFDPPFDAPNVYQSIQLKYPGASSVLVFGDCMNAVARNIDTALPWRFQFVWDGVTRWVVPGRPLIAHKTCDWFTESDKYDHEVVKDPRVIKTTPTRGSNARGTYEIAPDPRGQSLASVFRSPITSESHGAEHSKPVLWLSMIIGNCTSGPVLDHFCGSGSSIIACESIGRTAYGIEINPAYCDVIVKRWESFTGQTATREAIA